MKKNKVQEWSNELLNDDSFNIPKGILETLSSQPPSDMGLYYLQGLEGVSIKLNLKLLVRITSSYTGSTSAFSTTEQCTCLPQTHSHSDSSSPCSQFLKNHNLVVQSSQPYSNNWSQDQDNLNLQSSDYLESFMKVPIQNNQTLKSDLFELPQKSAKLDSSLKWRPNCISFEGNQCNKVGCNHRRSQLPKPISMTNSSSVLSRVAASSKTRIRWTQDLHN
nr:hypothetical protein CFP56_41847 [Quercus suber]